MTKKEKANAENRVLLELLETATDLSEYGLISEAEMAQMEALQSGQDESTSIRVEIPHTKK